jgi:hypothetical protein
MTIDTEQYTRFVQQGQDAVRNTVETWTNTVKTAVAQVPALTAQFDAEAAVDRYFDLTEKVLETSATSPSASSPPARRSPRP